MGTGGAKSAGVAALVKQVNGSIGYVEYTYAQQNNISTVMMKNADGKVVAPTPRRLRRGRQERHLGRLQGFAQALVNEPGATAWPITGATFALMQKSQTDAATAQMVLKFFDWGYKSGGSAGPEPELRADPGQGLQRGRTAVDADHGQRHGRLARLTT